MFIELTKKLKPMENEKFLLAVSGGLDSMALFHIFLHFKKNFSFQFAVAHFHHGPHSESSLLKFRFEAHKLIQEECEKNPKTPKPLRQIMNYLRSKARN